jgi:catechol 2,3-dioxygenase-like lactoylglutathione lyase family enzyme
MAATPTPPPAGEKLAAVLPVDDLDAAVEFYRQVLGTEPTFVDGDRWAQFDLGGTRLALAGADRASDAPGIMVKVADIDAARDAAKVAGLDASPIDQGPHERRFLLTSPDGHAVTVYAPT